jgi:hypothetical protein
LSRADDLLNLRKRFLIHAVSRHEVATSGAASEPQFTETKAIGGIPGGRNSTVSSRMLDITDDRNN